MLDKIVFFLYVVKCGSFSDAAKQYGISSSAGSRWILELEDKMGVNLLKRSTRKVVPTQAGMCLFERFNSVNQEIDSIFNEIQSLGNENKGVIKIASTPLFINRYLGRIIGEYLQMYPEINFKVIQTAFQVDHIEDVDFAIRAAATYQGYQEKDSLLVRRSILKESLVACCSPKYIEKFSEPKTPEELRRHNCLYTSTLVGGNRWIFEKDGHYTTIEIAQTVEIEDSLMLKTVALEGGGVAYLPINLIRKELETGQLLSILKDYVSSDFEFSLYFRPRKQMPTRCANFKSYLLSRVLEIEEENRKYFDDPPFVPIP